MAFVNPLDRLPQVPQSWANHVIWGGVLGAAASAAAAWIDLPFELEFGLGVTLIVATVKKAVDYAETQESAAECIGKVFATAVWPATLAIVGAL
jgi:hypothetical protein